ncbi:MAG: dicarboxylate--CoA ligase PimA [Micavibrio aeruginosavorus]|uniref:Dicarboxylate--CoA ligase PimA n=1 Tax=Micavibrio aeruginosavorus TaxID=349221 RepID=A0A2W5PMI8_9BACT|nr:MAG: dicarboxylate--CoA ligase PimA [Micavibrio aeruginosavorus]
MLFPSPELYRNSYPQGVQWEAHIPVYPVFDMLERTAEHFGDRPAFDFLNFKLSWGEIHDQASRLARALQDRGIGKGRRVGIFLPNCPNFVIAYYAIMRTGATAVNYNPLYSEKELMHQINDSGTDTMIAADLELLYGKMKKMIGNTCLEHLILCKFTDMLPFPKNLLFPLLKKKDLAKVESESDVSWYHDLINHSNKPLPVEIDPVNDVALLQYTGGTTGVPKGAMLTHQNIVANVEQCSMWLTGVKMGQEKMLGVLPFFHVFAMTTVMNFAVRHALEIVALPRFELEATLKLIHKKQPHYFPAVPAIYNAVNNYKNLSKFNLRSLRSCISGGAPLPVEVKKTFERNTGCVVIEGYGLTESSPVVSANPCQGLNKPGSIGLPFPGTIVEIVNPDDKKTLMPIGERGELCVRGPQVMKGYWGKEEATLDVLKDGRLHTGDVAIMDQDGYIFIVDRLKDMIITNGYNVYPRNVEEAIYQNDAVEECIVAGLPDAARGEIVKAWIKLKSGETLTADKLKEFLSTRISPMEMPRQIEFRDQPLPKTMIGKLSRKDILAEEKAKKS